MSTQYLDTYLEDAHSHVLYILAYNTSKSCMQNSALLVKNTSQGMLDYHRLFITVHIFMATLTVLEAQQCYLKHFKNVTDGKLYGNVLVHCCECFTLDLVQFFS